jgi:hypothetical protein
MKFSIAARAFFVCMIFLFFVNASSAQTATTENENARTTNINAKDEKSELAEIIQLLREQQKELERLRVKVDEQSKTIDELRQRVDKNEAVSTKTSSSSTPVETQTNSSPQNTQDTRLARVEEQTKRNSESISNQLGSIKFSGDFRLRYESIYGQLNSSANANNPAINGNKISSRQRFRFRARFGMRGQIGDTVEWGIRFASSAPSNPVSTNQTLSDFFSRKPFELDQVYIAWSPKISAGTKILRLQAGKFEPPWTRTEMTIDNDLMVEGFSESYRINFKNRHLENLTFIAWQLPLFERNAAFVRNVNGTVNVEESRRGGRDLALYGGQAQARFVFEKNISLILSIADLYYSGTQFITPIQTFGANLLIPVTITIPASGTTPAQTVTTQVSIPREFFIGGGGLGLSVASNNQTNRDGRLSSGFNLIDAIGRLNFWVYKNKIPVSLIVDFVRNTQTHPVIVAGANGANAFLPNNENSGYWAEIQAGKTQKRGDWLLGYTFIRIEKDAILSPFNFDDMVQQTDVRAHRVVFNYTLDPKVIFSLTGIFSQRANGLNGAFGNNPAGSLNRPTTRLQLDTIFRF